MHLGAERQLRITRKIGWQRHLHGAHAEATHVVVPLRRLVGCSGEIPAVDCEFAAVDRHGGRAGKFGKRQRDDGAKQPRVAPYLGRFSPADVRAALLAIGRGLVDEYERDRAVAAEV